tara:strand:+ start:61 stop:375 length:315 start_codon:yes stop_codon:yes gene_type:complete
LSRIIRISGICCKIQCIHEIFDKGTDGCFGHYVWQTVLQICAEISFARGDVFFGYEQNKFLPFGDVVGAHANAVFFYIVSEPGVGGSRIKRHIVDAVFDAMDWV